MENIKCEICSKGFKTIEGLNQHKTDVHSGKKKKLNVRLYAVIVILVLIVLFLSWTFISNSKKPGKYDDFAKCLTEKGAVIYGNDFCEYTRKEMNFFGKSSKYLNYIKCINNKALCDSKGVKLTPTWEINGEMHEQVQTLERLAYLTGCKL